MNKSFCYTCTSPDETMNFGEKTGRLIQKPLGIALLGDMGAGKTVFCKGLAKGLEVPPAFLITSPTYTLIHEYPGRLPFFHMDLYRIENTTDFDELGLFELIDGKGVSAVEWAERLDETEIEDFLKIKFEINASDTDRMLHLSAGGQIATDLIRSLENLVGE
ncbi:tRNA (adenosine(37)-N6)-threonylcarbamoyltransferase complex ATPase subunit type 1 TsaE [Desulfobacterales bacterium HSG17]|nr:tRNA (adenosine(37)-N6)-threonylcarbamoyltransferase complex ATPase subunit type 1 TsaE [Desulfobacterales bacterium HSG17]